MRVAWISDTSFFGGGAGRTDQEIILEGIRRDYDIYICLPRTEVHESDVYIISNAVQFPKEFLTKLSPRIVFLHDWFPLCDYRLLYPMQEKCKGCKNRGYTLKLLQGSKLVFFMSRLHMDGWTWALPEVKDLPYELVPSAFSKSQVEELKTLRNSMPDENTVLSVNGLLPYKGRDLVLKYAEEHQNLRFTFVGASEGVEQLPKNCRYIGPQPWKSLLHMYAVNESLIHLPQLEPCSRVVCESLLAGKRLIANRCVGLLSYFDYRVPTPEEVEKLVLVAGENFWSSVETKVNL